MRKLNYPGNYLKLNSGWLRVLDAGGLRTAPASVKNVTFGPLVIKVDGKAKIKDYSPTSGSEESERVKHTQVGTVGDLCGLNLNKVTVLVWHENASLTNDLGFFPATKQKKVKRTKAS